MKVFVYYNLHKKLWSVKALEGPNKGRVIAHKRHVNLTDVIFKVSQAGRERVIREQRKNVHAGVVGYMTANVMPLDGIWEEVTYNPYKFTTFVKRIDNYPPVTNAKYAVLLERKVFIS